MLKVKGIDEILISDNLAVIEIQLKLLWQMCCKGNF